jgi:hypothetical protein
MMEKPVDRLHGIETSFYIFLGLSLVSLTVVGPAQTPEVMEDGERAQQIVRDQRNGALVPHVAIG